MSGYKPISFVKETGKESGKDDSMVEALEAAFSAAADAISAVLAPTTSVDSQPETGLEDVVEPKDTDMEKKSDEEWEITDAIPITETDMVGDILQDKGAKDREQFGGCQRKGYGPAGRLDAAHQETVHGRRAGRLFAWLADISIFSMEGFYVLQGSLGNHCGPSGSLG